MFNYSEQIAQDMNIKIQSPEHQKLFRKQPSQIKTASHEEEYKDCCACAGPKCDKECPCKSKCAQDCSMCYDKRIVAQDIFLQILKLSEFLDNKGIEKTAQSLLDSLDMGDEELLDEDIESEGLSDEEEDSLSTAIEELKLEPPEDLPDVVEGNSWNPEELSELGDYEVDLISQDEEEPEIAWSSDVVAKERFYLLKNAQNSYLANKMLKKFPGMTIEEIRNKIEQKIQYLEKFYEALEGKSSFKEITLPEDPWTLEENKAWGNIIYEDDNDEITTACKILDSYIKKQAQLEDIDLVDLGLKMMNWHSGQGDPIYNVASYFVDGEEYPDLHEVDRAKNYLVGDLLKQQKLLKIKQSEIEPSLRTWKKDPTIEQFLEEDKGIDIESTTDKISEIRKNIEELEEIVFNLDAYLQQKGYSEFEDLDEEV